MAWEDACGLIKSKKGGTGYVIGPTSMITCLHVVGDETQVKVVLRKQEIVANVARVDKDLDIALLTLAEPPAGVEPLKFADGCPADTRWKTYGYPGIAAGLPIPMQGYVAKPDGIDSLGQTSVVLYADQVRDQGQTVAGFSGSPILVNGLVVGSVKRILENPDRKGWPLYGLLWGTPSSDILKFLDAAPAGTAQPEPPGNDPLQGARHELDAIVSATGVYALWNSLQETGVLDEELSDRAANLLVAKGRPELALEIANSLGDSVRARRLRAFVLGKANQIEKSIELFEQLQEEGKLDADSGGMLAGRYRDMWIRSDETDNAWRRKSADTYKRYWDLHNDTYCGINAAAMALQEGKEADCRRIASRVLDKLDTQTPDKHDYWFLATRAEALLLLGDVAAARDAYSQAKGAAAGKDHAIAVMWKGAVRDLKKLGKPPDLLDDVLRPRAAAAFFGHSVDSPGRQPPRFPPTSVRAVRTAIGAKIRQYGIGFGVSCACRGSDLLFLDELIRRNGRALVVLTSPPDEFARTFVGPAWQPIFDDVMSSGKVEVKVLPPATDAWLDLRATIRSDLKRHAHALGCDPLLIAVWDGEPTYVGDSVTLWQASGDPVDYVPIGAAAGAVL